MVSILDDSALETPFKKSLQEFRCLASLPIWRSMLAVAGSVEVTEQAQSGSTSARLKQGAKLEVTDAPIETV